MRFVTDPTRHGIDLYKTQQTQVQIEFATYHPSLQIISQKSLFFHRNVLKIIVQLLIILFANIMTVPVHVINTIH